MNTATHRISHRLTVPALLIAALAAASCNPKQEPVAVGKWVPYEDPYFKVRFNYPENWHLVTESTRILLYDKQASMEAFFNPAESGTPDAVQISVGYAQGGPAPASEDRAEHLQAELRRQGYEVLEIIRDTLRSEPAHRLRYRAAVGPERTLTTERWILEKDLMLYNLQLSVLGEGYHSTGKMVFDSLLSSLRLPEKQVAVSTEPENLYPSGQLLTYKAHGFTMGYPSNYSASVLPKMGRYEHSVVFKGYRQDCFIRLDVFDAEGLSLDKVLGQNRKSFRPISQGEKVINGERALYLNYAPLPEVAGRVYFIVKNDKVYRLTENYYTPMRNRYIPVFERVVESFSIT